MDEDLDAYGPLEEDEFMAVRSCDENCHWSGEVYVVRQTYSSGSVEYWDCPSCGRNNETDFDTAGLTYP